MSLPIEEVIATMRELKVPVDLIIKVETELEAKEAELKREKEENKNPKSKNQFAVVLLDPENHVKGDVTAFVTQMPEGDDAGDALNRLHKASYEFNRSKKRGKNVTNLGDIGTVKRKFFKNENVHLKTAEPVRVLVSKGPIPTG